MLTLALALMWDVVLWLLNPYVVGLMIVVSIGYYLWHTQHYGLWKSLGVPGPSPRFPFGCSKIPFWTPVWEIDEFLYKHSNKKFTGYFEFYRPVLYVSDPELIRSITIKDFDSFVNRRELAFSEEFKGMLSIMKDKEWKDTRSVMTPTFSASKIKGMHQLCIDNAQNLNNYVRESMLNTGKVEFKDTFGRFTMDNIASCAFGLNCNSFKDPNTEFATHAGKIFQPPSLYGIFRFFLLMMFPKLAYKFPDPSKKISEFFSKVVKDTIKHRENEGSSRKDFLQLMLDTKTKDGKRVLNDQCILDQSVLFFIAGYDTTATLLTFASYAMATNPECQQLVHEEIDSVLKKHEGKMTYEAVCEMTYLDRVISETVRLYPVATRGERETNAPYTIPGTSITLPKGMLVQFAIFPVHRDPEYYPDPLRFDPDRFLPEVKETRPACTYIPFGSGPRNCIAMRFALFEVKVALASVLREFKLVPNKETPPLPLKFDTKTFFLMPENRIMMLNAETR